MLLKEGGRNRKGGKEGRIKGKGRDGGEEEQRKKRGRKYDVVRIVFMSYTVLI